MNNVLLEFVPIMGADGKEFEKVQLKINLPLLNECIKTFAKEFNDAQADAFKKTETLRGMSARYTKT